MGETLEDIEAWDFMRTEFGVGDDPIQPETTVSIEPNEILQKLLDAHVSLDLLEDGLCIALQHIETLLEDQKYGEAHTEVSNLRQVIEKVAGGK